MTFIENRNFQKPAKTEKSESERRDHRLLFRSPWKLWEFASLSIEYWNIQFHMVPYTKKKQQKQDFFQLFLVNEETIWNPHDDAYS